MNRTHPSPEFVRALVNSATINPFMRDLRRQLELRRDERVSPDRRAA